MSPVQRAVAALGASLASATAWYAVSAALWPGSSGQARALGFVAVLTVVLVAATVRAGTWRGLGVVPPRQWRRPALLLVPALLAVSPLVGGVRPLAAGTWAVLLAGYTLTGVAEELLWRGWVHRWLEPLGLTRAVLVGSALFGCAHLSNLLYRDSAALVLAQCWGAFCFGVGYAALRARTGALVPLMALHLVTDLAAQVTRLPTIPVLVAQDVVLLGLGLLLVGRPGTTEAAPLRVPESELA
jgi:membrane protease YdiL (CAAX protease family)